MTIEELLKLYAKSPQVGALAAALGKKSVRTVFLEGLMGSAAPMVFGALAHKLPATVLFIMQDAEEAGYFYHDLMQLLGTKDQDAVNAEHRSQVLFFPSSYRRAVKYGQRDAASEILRTEVLARLATSPSSLLPPPYSSSLVPKPWPNWSFRNGSSTTAPSCCIKAIPSMSTR